MTDRLAELFQSDGPIGSPFPQDRCNGNRALETHIHRAGAGQQRHRIDDSLAVFCPVDFSGSRLKSDGIIHTRFQRRPEAFEKTDLSRNQEVMVNPDGNIGGDVAVLRFIFRNPVPRRRPPAPVRKLGVRHPSIRPFRLPAASCHAEAHGAFHMIPGIRLSPA